MASTSTPTSSIQKRFKHDVFLSFRGIDSRNGFVGHLYKALEQHGIDTYKDDKKITKGKTISVELIQAIEDSKFYIIVFSEKYASSSWCLDELVKIIECQKTSEHTAYPVFLDVEPSEVRKQNGVVEVAFAKHVNDESAGKWRETLKKAADLAGWELKNIYNGDEAELVQKIVEELSLKLHYPGVDENLIGMETRIDGVISSLGLGDDDVRIIGLKGMGGAGKTTLARAVYDHISYQFEGCSFVENVREKSTSSGLNLLQQQVLSEVLSDQGISVSGVLDGTGMLKKKIHGRKALIVLDDVDKLQQLRALAGDPSWFKSGSRIIITTRNAEVLIAHKVNLIHDVRLLDDKEAMCLFSRNAFGRESPIEGYKHLSEVALRYAAGLPLTISVLGSSLSSKHDLDDWKDELERLEKFPLTDTMKVLEWSYTGLEDDHKEIFLDVACLLKGWDKDDAIRALKSRGFHARCGLGVLVHRSLLTIALDGVVRMHDHIVEMGRNIVRRENPKERHSRLWIHDDIKDILVNNMGTQATECIKLDAYADGLNFEILKKGLANMKELRFLHVHAKYASKGEVSNWNFDEDSLHLPNALQFLSWDGYPFSSLPKTFQANNLVGLNMFSSNMVQLWKDGEEKALKLRFLKFRFSHYLRTLGLSVAPNLETLILERCDDLEEVHFQVIPNLKELCIDRCYKLKKLHMPAESPELTSLNLLESSKLTTLRLGKTPNLKTIILQDCTAMDEFRMPAESPELRSLNLLGSSKLTTLRLGKTPNLKTLILQDCTEMDELHMPAECPKLVNLDLNNLNLRTLHLGNTPNLETLKLWRCPRMNELHMPAECPELVTLDLSFLRLTTLRLGNTPNLETLKLQHCTEMVELAECPKLVNLNLFDLKLTTPQILQILAKCRKLVNLDLSYLELTTLSLGIYPKLERLSLNNCTDMVELHIECPKLVTLHLYNNPNLKSLDLKNCYDLEKIQTDCLKKLLHLRLSNCGRFESFEFDKELDSPEVVSLSELHLIADDTGICDPGNNWPEYKFSCYYKEDPASSFGNLERLISLGFGAPINVDSFSDIICGLQCLRKLTLEGGIPEAPKNLDQLDCLEELSLLCTKIKTLPDSLCMLEHLKSLEIISCRLLEKLPDDIGRLQCLEKLIVKDCIVLRDIPNSICEMHRLESLDLTGCIRIEELPEVIGGLEYLKELDITGTGITRLPKSIYQLSDLHIIGDDNDDDDVEDVGRGGGDDDDGDGDDNGDDDDDDDDDGDDGDNVYDDDGMLMGMLML